MGMDEGGGGVEASVNIGGTGGAVHWWYNAILDVSRTL